MLGLTLRCRLEDGLSHRFALRLRNAGIDGERNRLRIEDRIAVLFPYASIPALQH